MVTAMKEVDKRKRKSKRKNGRLTTQILAHVDWRTISLDERSVADDLNPRDFDIDDAHKIELRD